MKTDSSIASTQLTVLGKILKKLDDMPKWYAKSDWPKNLSKRDILDKMHITFIEITEELGQIKDMNNVAYSIIHEKLETINSRCWSVKKASSGLETKGIEEILKIDLFTDQILELETKKLSLFIEKYLLKIEPKIQNDNVSKEATMIDLSNTNGPEKIILLEKTGVLDYLRTKYPFSTSINMLASVLSGITGIGQKTIQSMINPIFSPNAGQKNNPLISETAVKKALSKLNSIGYQENLL